jgi:hypothetical protein
MVFSLGFRVQSLGVGIQGVRFGIQDSGCTSLGLIGVQGPGSRVQGFGLSGTGVRSLELVVSREATRDRRQ